MTQKNSKVLPSHGIGMCNGALFIENKARYVSAEGRKKLILRTGGLMLS